MKALRQSFAAALFMICLLGLLPVSAAAAAEADSVTAVYFYSPTCGSCHDAGTALTRYRQSHKKFRLVAYDITDLRYRKLFNRYCSFYHVSESDSTVPLLFAGDRFFPDIPSEAALTEDLRQVDGKKTPLLAGENTDGTDGRRFSGYSAAGVFGAGLVNGFNPCSLSMILFFLSLLALGRKQIGKLGGFFCAGKFIGYLALGTVLFGFLSELGAPWLRTWVKLAAVLLLLILIFLNLRDFLFARREEYGRMKLQLPSRIKKFNHDMIRRVSAVSRPGLFLVFSFALGAVLSAGEFLCTGQIYLATIVAVLQTVPDLSLLAFMYLLLYDLGYILPPVVLTAAVAKEKEVFELSEFVREHLPAVKLLNAAILLAIGVAMVLI